VLALRRREGEKVMIGDNIHVTVLEIAHGQVLLGFDAPAGVAVHRLEVYRRVKLGLEPLRRTPRAVEPEDDEYDGGSIS